MEVFLNGKILVLHEMNCIEFDMVGESTHI